MHPIVIIVICLVVFSFIAFFIAYSEEKKVIKMDRKVSKKLVDNPSILFEDNSTKSEDDIEII